MHVCHHTQCFFALAVLALQAPGETFIIPQALLPPSGDIGYPPYANALAKEEGGYQTLVMLSTSSGASVTSGVLGDGVHYAFTCKQEVATPLPVPQAVLSTPVTSSDGIYGYYWAGQYGGSGSSAAPYVALSDVSWSSDQGTDRLVYQRTGCELINRAVAGRTLPINFVGSITINACVTPHP